MCLAIPSKIVEIDGFKAVIDVCGLKREANLMLLGEDVDLGDYVLVYSGFAMRKVEREAALESLSFIETLVHEAREEINGSFDHNNADRP